MLPHVPHVLSWIFLFVDAMPWISVGFLVSDGRGIVVEIVSADSKRIAYTTANARARFNDDLQLAGRTRTTGIRLRTHTRLLRKHFKGGRERYSWSTRCWGRSAQRSANKVARASWCPSRTAEGLRLGSSSTPEQWSVRRVLVKKVFTACHEHIHGAKAVMPELERWAPKCA